MQPPCIDGRTRPCAGVPAPPESLCNDWCRQSDAWGWGPGEPHSATRVNGGMAMRVHNSEHGLSVRATAGTHTVLLGFDLVDPAGCLGFGIHRTDHTEEE